ncbi:MAG TPA: MFS transporter, partial [Acidimicrobiales bacterium]|nr:MFS transporter [Acidimicrobiales bacterium]
LGRRWFLFGAPIGLGLTSLALLAVHSVIAVVALRLVQGVVGSTFYTAAATVATDLTPEERRARGIARFSLFLYGGFAIGPALGEFLLDRGGFGLAWGVTAGMAAGSAAIALFLPETRPADQPRPTGKFQLVHPAAVGPGLVLLTAAVGYTAISVFSPLYATTIGMSSSGPLYLSFALTVIGVRLFGGALADRYGRVEVALPGMLGGAAGLGLLAFGGRPLTALLGVSLFGAGFALIFPALMALCADRAAPADRGAALGSFTAFFDLGAAGGGYAVGAVADDHGYTAAYAGPAVLCVVGAAGLLRLRRHASAAASDEADRHPLPEPAGS